MTAPLETRPQLSAISAASEAMDLAGKRLFPFRFERWLALGFVAFLDQCGRDSGGGGGGGTGFRMPGGNLPTGGGFDRGELANATDWISEHAVIILAVGAIALVLLLAFAALVLWIHSRGVFMYADNVASGRFDVARPWREHARRAWSFFGWSYGVFLAALAGMLALLASIVWMGFWVAHGGAVGGAIALLVLAILLFVAYAIVLNLFLLVLRDFAAPLQMYLDVSCGRAVGQAWGLVRRHLGTFLVYLLLKIVFTIGAAIVTLVAGCFTCCLGFLPVVRHTLLQPVYYFERAWSLCLLRQAGYDLIAVPAPEAAPPLAPPAPPASPLAP